MLKPSAFRLVFLLLCALALGVAGVLAQTTPQQPYHIIAKWKIGGASSWDYVHIDTASQRLYVSHGQNVEILEAKTGKILGTVEGLKGCHGIALDAAGKFGYISDGSGIVIFDTATFAKVKTIPTQYGPDGIIFEPVTKTVWSLNGHGNGANAVAVDTTTQEQVATVNPPKDNFEGSTVDGMGHVFANVGGDIARIDAKTKQVDVVWTTGCNPGNGLAFDREGNRIFQACRDSKLYTVDATSGKVLGASQIGTGPDGAGYSAKYHLAFASTSDGIISVVDVNAPGFPTIEKAESAQGARTMDYDPTTDRIYTISAERDPNVPMPGPRQGGPGGPVGPQGQSQPSPQVQGALQSQGGPGGQGQNRPSPYKPDTFFVVVLGR
jgi:hypothetical protein